MRGALTVAAVLIPTFHASLGMARGCLNGRVCTSQEYCSSFSETCEKCADICDKKSHNYQESDCSRFCPALGQDDGLHAQVSSIQHQQNVILIIVVILLVMIIISNGIKAMRWIRNRRCITKLLKSLSSKKEYKGKEQAVGTISNVMHMNEADRAQSQIYSVTGVEGSTVNTVTTPISTRYPAEDSTTTTEYSYDNAGLQVTPSSNKPPFPQTVY